MGTDNGETLSKTRVIQHLMDFLGEELEGAESPEKREEIESLITMYRFLPARTYSPEDPIVPSSLVTLRIGDASTRAFIVPRGGGSITRVDGHPLQVLTPSSPLGEALLGRKTGDRVSVEVRGSVREYLIVASE
jgi:hypothetical protein